MDHIKLMRFLFLCTLTRIFDRSYYEQYASLQDAEQLALKNTSNNPHLELAD